MRLLCPSPASKGRNSPDFLSISFSGTIRLLVSLTNIENRMAIPRNDIAGRSRKTEVRMMRGAEIKVRRTTSEMARALVTQPLPAKRYVAVIVSKVINA
jgi:hypothetical protein